ncbi:MAG: PE family protein [Mycobacterium sp.]|uniref:PE family protein n=1 Tax=Mycobacterium sp. TaxID=1785 RepID=UPI001ECEF6F4|nr:PE family protein [Mycobacterium sp.]MBW0019988.1 PE family protein [Mycobacterium sp.]
MSFLIAVPETVAGAASNLESIGSSISAANSAAVTPTTAVLPAAADEVSEVISSLFVSYAQGFQVLSAQAATFHSQFVQLLSASAGQYAAEEAANAAALPNTAAVVVNPPPPTTPTTGPTLGPLGQAWAGAEQEISTVISYLPPPVRTPVQSLLSGPEQGISNGISYLDPFAANAWSGFRAAIS